MTEIVDVLPSKSALYGLLSFTRYQPYRDIMTKGECGAQFHGPPHEHRLEISTLDSVSHVNPVKTKQKLTTSGPSASSPRPWTPPLGRPSDNVADAWLASLALGLPVYFARCLPNCASTI